MKKVDNQYVPLCTYELFCYIIIWASSVIYISYNIFNISSSEYFMINF